MTKQELFLHAAEAMNQTVSHIQADQWNLELPPGLTWNDKVKTLRDLVNAHAYDASWVPETLSGKTIAEVGEAYNGDLLGDDPRASYSVANARAQAAVRSFEDLDHTVHLSYGDYTAGVYLDHITIFYGLQAYDVAKLIGVDTALPADLVQGLWDLIQPISEDLRAMGVFGPAVTVDEGADLQTRLLGLCGRTA